MIEDRQQEILLAQLNHYLGIPTRPDHLAMDQIWTLFPEGMDLGVHAVILEWDEETALVTPLDTRLAARTPLEPVFPPEELFTGDEESSLVGVLHLTTLVSVQTIKDGEFLGNLSPDGGRKLRRALKQWHHLQALHNQVLHREREGQLTDQDLDLLSQEGYFNLLPKNPAAFFERNQELESIIHPLQCPALLELETRQQESPNMGGRIMRFTLKDFHSTSSEAEASGKEEERLAAAAGALSELDELTRQFDHTPTRTLVLEDPQWQGSIELVLRGTMIHLKFHPTDGTNGHAPVLHILRSLESWEEIPWVTGNAFLGESAESNTSWLKDQLQLKINHSVVSIQRHENLW